MQQSHTGLDAARFAHLVTLFDSPSEGEAQAALWHAVRLAKKSGLRLVDALETTAVRTILFEAVKPLGMKRPGYHANDNQDAATLQDNYACLRAKFEAQGAACAQMAARIQQLETQLQAAQRQPVLARIAALGAQIQATRAGITLYEGKRMAREVKTQVLMPLRKRILIAWLKEEFVPMVCFALVVLVALIVYGLWSAKIGGQEIINDDGAGAVPTLSDGPASTDVGTSGGIVNPKRNPKRNPKTEGPSPLGGIRPNPDIDDGAGAVPTLLDGPTSTDVGTSDGVVNPKRNPKTEGSSPLGGIRPNPEPSAPRR